MSLAANLEMHASQQKDFDSSYQKTIKVVKRGMSKEKPLPIVTGFDVRECILDPFSLL